MKRIYMIVLAASSALAFATTASAQISYENTSGKANRFFDHSEWASAAATYTLMLHERPQVADTYGRAIVSYEMLGEPQRSIELLGQAMDYGVPLDSVLCKVKHYSFEVGKINMYENFMLDASEHFTWLARPLDAYMLDYYVFRNNGDKIIVYAQRMLAGAPRNTNFMLQLAKGYVLTSQDAKAVETWQRALTVNPECYQTILNLANYYYLTNDTAQALKYYRQADSIRRSPFIDQSIKKLSSK